MNPTSAEILKIAGSIDETFDSKVKNRFSLNPDMITANSFYCIFDNLIQDKTDLDLLIIFAEKFATIIDSILINFPKSIFWDFDYFCKSLMSEKQSIEDWKSEFDQRLELILSINERFGCKSSIRFQYYHDFLYGFDWFKWMNLENRESSKADPFGIEFLSYINNRGKEMEVLIEKNSEEYGQIEDHSFRNPFYFTRTDNDEMLLMRNLASNDELPLQTWKLYPNLECKKDYSEIRNKRAFELNISANKDKSAHKI
ncbi:hypothetical protein [Leptospira sp. GIMC2001]|uniref:hypothetical protein n=1 Tax=Leptospira sp. GIMC2001 TaxID=1513297 RepID=UPI00234B19A8|nr:hypothetical protein [Leptospira sp. GIMC2001]WCL50907.1 hypothetical protein O4O04_08870 [Leptospira sp. GIMC2001]